MENLTVKSPAQTADDESEKGAVMSDDEGNLAIYTLVIHTNIVRGEKHPMASLTLISSNTHDRRRCTLNRNYWSFIPMITNRVPQTRT